MRLPWTDRVPRPPLFRRSTRRSLYLTMPDGVRIAIDLTLPDPMPSTKLPAIVRQTRYHRRFSYQRPFDLPSFQQLFDRQYVARKTFVSRGYAWIDVCARGSGASGGARPTPWSADEIGDGREILDWIVAQPWSNGRVGARGVSYDGTSAEWMLVHRHPALRAVAPRFALFDVFEDIAHPGGIHLEQFTRSWAAFNAALDRNRVDEVLALVVALSRDGLHQLAESFYALEEDGVVATAMLLSPLTRPLLTKLVAGVASVDDDLDQSILSEHLARRRPALDVHRAAQQMTFRDDRASNGDGPPTFDIAAFSPSERLDELRGSGVPVYHYTGWFDGAYQRAAIRKFLAHDDPNHRLIIGPWEHGGQQNVSPWEPSRDARFDHEAELLRFFDAHLFGDGEAREAWDAEPRVRYFTMGAERWRTSDTWPPAGATKHRLFFGSAGALSSERPGEETHDRLFVRGRHGSGKASRWRCLLPTLAHTHYLPRSGDDILEYRSTPLRQDVEVTGSPVVHVELTSSTEDPRLFVYLEDVEHDAVTHYVTEGQLRAIHRQTNLDAPRWWDGVPYRTYRRHDRLDTPRGTRFRLEFDLLPTSYLFRRGHRIRVVLAGCDVDHFDIGPAGAHTIHLGASWIDLPVVTNRRNHPDLPLSE